MNIRKSVIAVFALALAATPAFAQVGVGVGVGNQAQVGVGTGAGVGVNTGAGIQVNAPAAVEGVGTVQQQTQSTVVSGADIATRLESNSQLAARVQSMLPADSTISTAAAGFKNEGQFLAALHASQNLDIPFSELKSRMTGSNAASLGNAIRSSKPEMSKSHANEAAKKAEAQAKATASMKANASTKSEASTNAATNPPGKR
jgi:hypothetical protein